MGFRIIDFIFEVYYFCAEQNYRNVAISCSLRSQGEVGTLLGRRYKNWSGANAAQKSTKLSSYLLGNKAGAGFHDFFF